MHPKNYKAIWIMGALVFIIIGGLLLTDYFAVLKKRIAPGAIPDNNKNPEFIIEEVASNLDTPWSIVFTSPNRMLVSERPGRIRVIENGFLKSEPLHTFTEVKESGEQGLMSLAIDPAYATNKQLYASLAYSEAGKLYVK